MKCRNSQLAPAWGIAVAVGDSPIDASPSPLDGALRKKSGKRDLFGTQELRKSVLLREFLSSKSKPRRCLSPLRGERARSSQRGVALVLTLIMLAIITIVTVVFLATTRRNRLSVTVRKAQTDAELATEHAFQHANTKVIERLLRETNLLAFDFFVSRPLTYGYELAGNGAIIRPLDNDTIPRVVNNSNTVDVYLDLNRNRRFDDPGNVTNHPFGDPIWLGVLDRPWFPHSRTNHFIARFAYLVLPVGKALDLNTIHNDTSPNPGYGYMRNQGFGPWELNLGAFFHELDPVVWDYDYTRRGGKPEARGLAFADARSIVNYRHGWPDNPAAAPIPYDALSIAQTFAFPNPPPNFPPLSIDAYSDGNLGLPLGQNISLPDDDFPLKPARWAGADTTNHFFHLQELFDRANVVSNKVTLDFYNHLTNALTRQNFIGQTNGSLYYRMLAQLGTDSGSDVHDKINLNYADEHANIPGTNYSPTNFVAWDSSPILAAAFFTHVAERIFLAQSNEFNPGTNALIITSITNIPVFPTNMYSSAIHRVLQQAANILDATSTSNSPSVFLPNFSSNRAGIFLTGFTFDTTPMGARRWIATNISGIPPVVGTKKFMPNFNEYSLETHILVTRKLQFTRQMPPPTTPGQLAVITATNQMYIFGISNTFGIEGWNSYSKQFFRPGLQLEVSNYVTVTVTNSEDARLNYVTNFAAMPLTNSPVATSPFANPNVWPGGKFWLPMTNLAIILDNSVYRFDTATFDSLTNYFEPNTGFQLPHLMVTVSNRLSYLLHDGVNVLDCAVINNSANVDLFRELLANPNQGTTLSAAVAGVWDPTRYAGASGPTEGVRNQIQVSMDPASSTPTEWRDFNALATDKNRAVDGFRNFLGLTPVTGVRFNTNTTSQMQTGFNPAAMLVSIQSWQANDPLVHYHPSDLYPATNSQRMIPPKTPNTNVAPATLGYVNTPYAPWGGNTNQTQTSYDPNIYNMQVRDAGVYSSDDWQFPTNKFASIGLLGRVHRGTPWQSVYFKPEIAPLGTWSQQSPDVAFVNGRGDVSRTHPTNDWKLADMFTTALDERTSRGLVSINQTNMETWSALLSGVLVLSNAVAKPSVLGARQYDEWLIPPWGNVPLTNSALARIWSEIYAYQTNHVDNQGRRLPLESIGELIQNVPALTTKSPFLNTNSSEQLQWGLDDFAYEQIPQQILSLLRVGEARFVIYAYGQALKPADVDPATGRVNNYQVTAEHATRTVIRIEGDPHSRVRAVVESFNILPPD